MALQWDGGIGNLRGIVTRGLARSSQITLDGDILTTNGTGILQNVEPSTSPSGNERDP